LRFLPLANDILQPEQHGHRQIRVSKSARIVGRCDAIGDAVEHRVQATVSTLLQRLTDSLLQRVGLVAEPLLHDAVPPERGGANAWNLAQLAAFHRRACRHLEQLLLDISHWLHHAIEEHSSHRHAASRAEKGERRVMNTRAHIVPEIGWGNTKAQLTERFAIRLERRVVLIDRFAADIHVFDANHIAPTVAAATVLAHWFADKRRFRVRDILTGGRHYGAIGSAALRANLR
jgi:hypothetical protein